MDHTPGPWVTLAAMNDRAARHFGLFNAAVRSNGTQSQRGTVRFSWDAGSGGTLILDWRDGPDRHAQRHRRVIMGSAL
jgi:hypothetical protein